MTNVHSIRIVRDSEEDVAYITIGSRSETNIKETYTCDDLPADVHGDINLDFDNTGHLVGIEIIGASRVLRLHQTSEQD